MKIINPGSHFNLTGESEELSPLSLSPALKRVAPGTAHLLTFPLPSSEISVPAHRQSLHLYANGMDKKEQVRDRIWPEPK